MVHVNTSRPRVLVKLRATPMSHPTPPLNWKLPSLNNPFQLPLKPIKLLSKPIPQVSSPRIAVLNLTTVSLLLVMVLKTELTTSSSRTPGLPLGETMDISKSDKTTFVVSSRWHPTQLSERTFVFFDVSNKIKNRLY